MLKNMILQLFTELLWTRGFFNVLEDWHDAFYSKIRLKVRKREKKTVWIT